MDAISNWVTSPKPEIKLAKPKGELRQKRKKKLAGKTECREQQKDDKKEQEEEGVSQSNAMRIAEKSAIKMRLEKYAE